MLSFCQSSLEDLSEVGVVNVREATGQAIEQSRKPIDCNAEEHSAVSNTRYASLRAFSRSERSVRWYMGPINSTASQASSSCYRWRTSHNRTLAIDCMGSASEAARA